MTSEFGLVCEDKWKKTFAKMLLFSGKDITDSTGGMKEIDRKIVETGDVPEVTRFTTSEARSQANRHRCTEHLDMSTV